MQEVHLNILDTAGIHETEDVVEKIGVSRAMAHTEDADLILYVVDASVPLTRDDDMIGDLVKDKKTIILLNKSDLETIITPEEMEERLRKPVISISAREEHGIWELEKAIENLFFQGELEAEQDLLITNLRQEKLLEDTGKSLNLVRTSIENQMPEDFYSIDLMEAYTSLGKILGEEVGEDLVNEIFGKFCMGK